MPPTCPISPLDSQGKEQENALPLRSRNSFSGVCQLDLRYAGRDAKVAGTKGALNSRRATVRDVAALAQVSTATVSRALNGFSTVDEEMVARVLRAAKELGYRPDGSGRSLRRGVNTVFGMLIPDIENPFFTSMVRGAEDAANRAGYLLLLCNTDESIEKEKAYLDFLMAQRVGGVLLAVADEQHSDIRDLIRAGTPVVAVDRRGHESPVDAVLSDNIAGSRAATEWLVGRGYTRIATIAGPGRTTTGLERLMGYQQAMAAAGISAVDDLVVYGDFHADGGYRAASQLLDSDPRPEAVFVANNQMTIGAIAAITDRGLEVPSDVALACFDQLPPGLRFSDEIATVEQPSYVMGRTAVEMLLRRIAGEDGATSEIRLQSELHEPLSAATTSGHHSRSRGHAATQ